MTLLQAARRDADTRPGVGSQTPWGKAQTARLLAKGIVYVTTPSHGGLWLSHDRMAAMRQYSSEGDPKRWYEEDCEMAAPMLRFANDIDAASSWSGHPKVNRKHCRLTVRWHVAWKRRNRRLNAPKGGAA